MFNASRVGLLVSAVTVLALFPCSCSAEDAAAQQSQWVKFRRLESSIKRPPAGRPMTDPNEAVHQGYFTVPAYFSSQPKPYERPTEIFRTPTTVDTTSSTSVNTFKATLPFVVSGGAYPWGGYGGWGGYRSYWSPWTVAPYSYLPGSAWGGPAAPFAWGGAPYSWGGGYWGGPGWSGGIPWGGGWGGPYGWYANPGFGSLMMGAFGNAGRSSDLGVVTPTRVIQSAPSKASGNYYAPSTVDPSASGSYYATTTPAQTPIMSPPKVIKNFWGGGGSPFPSDLNSVPWNK